jgi:choline dehydrogenase-like flavoprotein
MEMPFSALAGLEGLDYCVIGSGPAGMTCARELAARKHKVLLIEGGGRSWSEESQSLYRGETIGDKYFALDACRLRYLGGSSNHWTGWCRPLDVGDFEGKGPNRIGKWPFARSELDPYVQRAADILEVAPPPADVALPGGLLRKIQFSFSPPVRFGEKYADEIAASERLIFAVDCNLTLMNVAGGAISSITVQSYDGASAEIKARVFILACGGIENSRLLLWCNAAANGALLGRQADLVGRYWCEHHFAKIGDALVDSDFVVEPDPDGPTGASMTFVSMTPQMLAETGILSCGLRLLPSSGGEAKALLADVACVAPTWANWAYDAVANGTLCAHELRVTAEQEPVFDNRVALGPAKDRFGIPTVQLHWRRSELDLKTMREAAQALAFHLAAYDIGRARLEPWVLGEADYPTDVEIAGYHHMGGTLMSDDPATGVVDRNCRLLGMANLYVTGSSVFPSGGHSTPTMTIVQLALRLADHLAAEDEKRVGTDVGLEPLPQ